MIKIIRTEHGLVHTIFILTLLSYENRVSISFNKCLQTQLLNPNAGRACRACRARIKFKGPFVFPIEEINVNTGLKAFAGNLVTYF